MLQYEQNLISRILEEAGLSSLPDAVSAESFTWIEGIAKIELQNGEIAYGIIKRLPNINDYVVTRIIGSTIAMKQLIEVYPYVKLDGRYVRKFKDDEDRESRIAYLSSPEMPYQIGFDLETATIEDLNREIVKVALFKQLNKQSEE